MTTDALVNLAIARYELDYATGQLAGNLAYPRSRKGWERRVRKARKALARAQRKAV